MLRKPHCFLICVFLCTVFNLRAQDADLSAALCEMASWESGSAIIGDSLLFRKATFLMEAGKPAAAYSTLCRISPFGKDVGMRWDLLRKKMICAWEAGMMDDFCAMLDEACAEGIVSSPAPSGKLRRRNPNAAMLMSVIPGLGHAYSGEWEKAGRNFLVECGILSAMSFAFWSGLPLTAILGGGILLYETLPAITADAIACAGIYNDKARKEFFTPIYMELSACE